MPPGHVAPDHHHVRAPHHARTTSGSASTAYSRPSVRHTSRPPVGPGGDLPWTGGQVGEGTGVEELGIARSLGVHRENLVVDDLDLVAVQHRGRVGAQPDAVDGDLGIGGRGADRRRAFGGPLDDGMAGPHPLALEHDGAAKGRSL